MRNRYEPKPYELKILELQKQVEAEAKNLQNIIEAKDSSLRDIQTVVERKSSLLLQINNLDNEIKQKKIHLQETIDKKNDVISSTKIELEKEKKSLSHSWTVFSPGM